MAYKTKRNRPKKVYLLIGVNKKTTNSFPLDAYSTRKKAEKNIVNTPKYVHYVSEIIVR